MGISLLEPLAEIKVMAERIVTEFESFGVNHYEYDAMKTQLKLLRVIERLIEQRDSNIEDNPLCKQIIEMQNLELIELLK
jgi:hypothetical protein